MQASNKHYVPHVNSLWHMRIFFKVRLLRRWQYSHFIKCHWTTMTDNRAKNMPNTINIGKSYFETRLISKPSGDQWDHTNFSSRQASNKHCAPRVNSLWPHGVCTSNVKAASHVLFFSQFSVEYWSVRKAWQDFEFCIGDFWYFILFFFISPAHVTFSGDFHFRRL